jgi:hypothetical protein
MDLEEAIGQARQAAWVVALLALGVALDLRHAGRLARRSRAHLARVELHALNCASCQPAADAS